MGFLKSTNRGGKTYHTLTYTDEVDALDEFAHLKAHLDNRTTGKRSVIVLNSSGEGAQTQAL